MGFSFFFKVGDIIIVMDMQISFFLLLFFLHKIIPLAADKKNKKKRMMKFLRQESGVRTDWASTWRKFYLVIF